MPPSPPLRARRRVRPASNPRGRATWPCGLDRGPSAACSATELVRAAEVLRVAALEAVLELQEQGGAEYVRLPLCAAGGEDNADKWA